MIKRNQHNDLVIQVNFMLSPRLQYPTQAELERFAREVCALDRRLFESTTINPAGSPFLRIERICQAPGIAQLQHTPLILHSVKLELGLLMKVGVSKTWLADSAQYHDPEGVRKLAVSVAEKFANCFEDVGITRVGKVYNYTFGPTDQDATQWIRKRFIDVDDPNFKNGSVFFLTHNDGINYNHTIEAAALPNGQTAVKLVVDVCNADVTHRLDLTAISPILDKASRYNSVKDGRLWTLLEEQANDH